MPELPEVESVRRSLLRHLPGRTITAVKLLRPDIVTGPATPSALLRGRTIGDILRHGKQLAILTQASANPPCLCVHLGMTGSLRYFPSSAIGHAKSATQPDLPPHAHIIWQLDDGGKLVFADPRRFGGIWTYPNPAALRESRWNTLGADALTITPRQLHSRLAASRRPLKSALLDQNLIAGLGNIYVDELLFDCRLHPSTPCDCLTFDQVRALVSRMRRLLGRAIRAGGSTLRDYVDGQGNPGGFQFRHKVYGRAGQPCRNCRALLQSLTLAGRTTVYCPACQTIHNSPTSCGKP